MNQKQALDILKLGHNVFLTGEAGSGKTFVLNQFINHLRANRIGVGITASTGIAATHLGGMTIHSWAGIGIKDQLNEFDVSKLQKNNRIKQRFKQTKVLIIDEISMLHGVRLDLVDQVARLMLNPNKPFGGLQVVLSGDLFQLPPVSRGQEPDFVFESNAWKSMNLVICYLNEQHRQEDMQLLDLLNSIRADTIEDHHHELLCTRFMDSPTSRAITKLYTHNANVDQINNAELQALETKEKTFDMETSGRKWGLEILMNSNLALEQLRLKSGAEVMFITNKFDTGYVNGTRGRVIDFSDEGHPIVQTKKKIIEVEPHTWKMEAEDGKTIATVTQYPLRLAWAITVHKSQGMSLDEAEVDLSQSFEPGMGYVALSRVRSLDGLYIKGLNNTAMRINNKIIALDAKLQTKSAQAVSALESMKEEDVKQKQGKVEAALKPEPTSDDPDFEYDEDLFETLRAWRRQTAEDRSVPAYVVLPDKTLKEIAAKLPTTKKELDSINGIGSKKIEDYGKMVIEIVKTHTK